MKKLISLFAAGLLVAAFAAPVAADTEVIGNSTEKIPVAFYDQVQPDADFIAVCFYAGDKASNWLINGFGGSCLNTGGVIKVLPVEALTGMIK
jgi:hypothetical protein